MPRNLLIGSGLGFSRPKEESTIDISEPVPQLRFNLPRVPLPPPRLPTPPRRAAAEEPFSLRGDMDRRDAMNATLDSNHNNTLRYRYYEDEGKTKAHKPRKQLNLDLWGSRTWRDRRDNQGGDDDDP